MFSLSLMPLGAVALYLLASSIPRLRGSSMHTLLLGAYLLRLILQYLVRNVAIFSHTAGGDSILYERLGAFVANIWEHKGIHFVTGEELPTLGTAVLHVNMIAVITYLNGGVAQEGATALCAFAGCLSGLNLYHLCLELGVPEKIALRFAAFLLFTPAFLLYTSQPFKDGFVVLFQFGAMASAIRLSRKFSLTHAILGAICLWALWYVRSYLVFASVIPLIVGLSGVNSRSAVRPALFAFAFFAVMLVVFLKTDLADTVLERASKAYDNGTDANVLKTDADSASGVTFDDGGNLYGALIPKLLYTMFSPFPWQWGSFGFQIGKIDSGLVTYFIYRAYLTCRKRWNEDRATILPFLSFILPMTLMYALTMSNVGLIVRQRIPIVVCVMVLAAMSFKTETATETLKAPEPVKRGRGRFSGFPGAKPRPTFASVETRREKLRALSKKSFR
jgi:hypothetical protein